MYQAMTNFIETIRHACLFFVGCFLLFFGAQAMAGIFGSNTLFSQVDGEVTLDGKPCASVKIQQKVFKANSDEISASTVTDDNGVFRFDEISEKKGFFSFLPSEFVATQRLVITYEGQEYLAWAHTKRSPERNAEASPRPFSLVCDLSKPPEEDDKYIGICRLKA